MTGKEEIGPTTENLQPKLNILIADDELAIRRIMARLLTVKLGEKIGIIELAEDGEIALKMIKENPKKYNTLITDGNMPGLNGLQLAQQSKEINPALVVALISAGIGQIDFSSPMGQEQARLHGADFALGKPFTGVEFDKLLADISNRINKE